MSDTFVSSAGLQEGKGTEERNSIPDLSLGEQLRLPFFAH